MRILPFNIRHTYVRALIGARPYSIVESRAMKHLISVSALFCVGAMFTWVTASVIEYSAQMKVGSAETRFVEPAAPVNTWGFSQTTAKSTFGRERASVTSVALAR